MRFLPQEKLCNLVCSAALILGGCGVDENAVVWPIYGYDPANTPLSSTFGPRVRTDDEIYDFHRGIDLAAPRGTNVIAMAKGRVFDIEEETSSGGMLVQIEHEGGYYTNYIHLFEIFVKVGDQVWPGDTIGRSGASSNGFEHLHFELRRPGDDKQYCVHPLNMLPYDDGGPPGFTLDSVDMGSPTSPIVNVTVSVPAKEVDLKRVSVATYEAPPGVKLTDLMPLSEQVYDIEEWNLLHTEDGGVDVQDLEGIEVRPQRYNGESSAFTLQFAFRKLVGPGATGLRVKASAVDVKGNVVEVESP